MRRHISQLPEMARDEVDSVLGDTEGEPGHLSKPFAGQKQKVNTTICRLKPRAPK